MIVVEGPDGSGKSTLVSILQEFIPHTLVLHSPGPLTEETVKERLFWGIALAPARNIIADRITAISEMVYGPVIRNNCLITHDDMTGFVSTIRENNGLIVYCKRKFKQVRDYRPTLNLDSKEKKELEQQVEEQSRDIRRGYQELFEEILYWHKKEHMVPPFYTINEEEDIPRLLNYIKQVIL